MALSKATLLSFSKAYSFINYSFIQKPLYSMIEITGLLPSGTEPNMYRISIVWHSSFLSIQLIKNSLSGILVFLNFQLYNCKAIEGPFTVLSEQAVKNSIWTITSLTLIVSNLKFLHPVQTEVKTSIGSLIANWAPTSLSLQVK